MVSQYNDAGKLEFKGRKTVSIDQHLKCKCGCVVKQEVRLIAFRATLRIFKTIDYYNICFFLFYRIVPLCKRTTPTSVVVCVVTKRTEISVTKNTI